GLRDGGEGRVLVPAGVAPRRPEIDDDRFAAVLREVDRLTAADCLEREVGSRFADERRLDVARVFAEGEVEHRAECRGEDDPEREDGPVHATTSPPSTSGAGAVFIAYVCRIGMSATTPPSPMSRTAIQIHETIGVMR